MLEKARVNQKHKDRLFRLLFHEKEDLLELYNAINETSYKNPDALEINTLEDSIYMTMKNDVSFLISGVLNLYEHQSTFNPNMPYRDLDYIVQLLRGYVEQHRLDVYGSRPIQLPTPKAVVFYNGKKEIPERMTQKLSDLYEVEDEEVSLEMKVLVLNINYGKNQKIMERCRKLEEYAIFISKIRHYQEQTGSIEEAVEKAMDACIEEKVLAGFLLKHRGEVRDMILTEYNEQEHIQNEKQWSYEDGWESGKRAGEERGRRLGEEIGEERGRQQGENRAVANMILRLSIKNGISFEEAMEMLDIPKEEREKYLDLIEKSDK